MSDFPYKPYGNRVIVQKIDQSRLTSFGIIIPDTVTQRATMGRVVAVGEGRRLSNGTLLIPEVSVDDVVYFATYSGNDMKSKVRDVMSEFKNSGGDYIILDAERDILAIVYEME